MAFNKLMTQTDPEPVAAYHRLAATCERRVALYLRRNDAAPDTGLAAKLDEWLRRLNELERQAGRAPGPRRSERCVPP